jgi:hypothetical protein
MQRAPSNAAVNIDRIDFISAYCDRWCERCAFTSRCSAFAADVAIAMCGDAREGLKLAVGTPHPAGPEAAPIPEWVAELDNIEMTPDERADFDRREKQRDARIDHSSILKIARACSMISHGSFTTRYDHVSRVPMTC